MLGNSGFRMVRTQECESGMQGLGNFRVSGLGLGPLEFRMLMGLRSLGF